MNKTPKKTTEMTTKRNPYKPFLRNVHVRRIYTITIFPLWILFEIPIVALKSIWKDLKVGMSGIIEAIKDGNSYD